jgi:PIN domain nuclease of toxin-antitoxin system
VKAVVLDTCTVMYIYNSHPDFADSLKEISKILSADGAQAFISVITVQEFGVFVDQQGKGADVDEWLLKTYTPLEFTTDCAKKAIELANLKGYPARQPGMSRKQQQAQVDVWHRDAAIMATAVKREANYFVTGDGGFKAYARHFAGRIWHLNHGFMSKT